MPGRCFNTECELVQVLRDSMPAMIEGTRPRFLAEVKVSGGVPDLLVVWPDFDSLRKRIRKVGPNTLESLTEIRIVMALYTARPLRITTIASWVGVSQREASRALGRLSELGFARETATGSFLREEWAVPHLRYAISVEAKLFKWRDALAQASRNLLFSDQAYVAMDAAYANRAFAHLDAFRRANVGLAAVDLDGNIMVKHRPRTRRSDRPNLFRWIVSEALVQSL